MPRIKPIFTSATKVPAGVINSLSAHTAGKSGLQDFYRHACASAPSEIFFDKLLIVGPGNSPIALYAMTPYSKDLREYLSGKGITLERKSTVTGFKAALAQMTKDRTPFVKNLRGLYMIAADNKPGLAVFPVTGLAGLVTVNFPLKDQSGQPFHIVPDEFLGFIFVEGARVPTINFEAAPEV